MIKWIGQHIVDLIARFRSDIYLENIEDGTVANDKFLGLDANNKIVKETVTSSSGDITEVGIRTEQDGTNNTITSGSVNFTILSGEGIDVISDGSANITVAGEDASTSNKGVASFSSNNFVADAGEISIKSGGVDLTNEVTGTLPVGNGVTGATTLTSNSVLTGNGTSAIQAESGLTYDSEVLNVGDDDDGVAEIRRLRHTDDDGGQLYIRGGDATGTDKDGGVLRLYGGRGTGAGSGGAVTIGTSAAGSSGTTFHSNDIVATFKSNKDTQLTGNLIFEGPTPDANETTFSITDPTADRTITVPDATGTMALTGVTGHYQYISFLSNMTTASNWKTVSNNGISNHTWNQSLGTNGTTVDTSTGTVPVSAIVGGIVVPYDCTLVGFKAIGMGGSNHQYELGLMVGVPTFNDYVGFDVTLRAYKAAVAGSPDSNYQSRAIAIEDLTRSYSITAGHVIYPCVKSASGSGTNKVSWTIVLKTLIPS